MTEEDKGLDVSIHFGDPQKLHEQCGVHADYNALLYPANHQDDLNAILHDGEIPEGKENGVVVEIDETPFKRYYTKMNLKELGKDITQAEVDDFMDEQGIEAEPLKWKAMPLAGVLYEPNQFYPRNHEWMDFVSFMAKGNDIGSLVICGYNDYNEQASGEGESLSTQRALVIKRLLLAMGVPDERMFAIGRPDCNFSKKSDERSRRVMMVLLGDAEKVSKIPMVH